MHRIIRAEPESDFVLRVWSSTGEDGLFGAGPYLDGPIYRPLRAPDYFRHVFVDPIAGTVCWPNGAGFCPDVVHRESICGTTKTS